MNEIKNEYVPVIYNQSKNTYTQVSQIQVNLNTLEIYRQQEELMELYCQKIFAYDRDRDFFTWINGVSKRMGLAHISKAIGEVLKPISPENIQLVFLADFVDRVFEKIKEYKSTIKICGNPNDEAEWSVFENKRKQFMEGLTMLTAMQVFAYKLKLNQIVNSKVAGAVDYNIWNRECTRAIFAGMWQIANTLKEGGVNPKEVKYLITEAVMADRKKLRENAQDAGWGYLQERLEEKIAEKTFAEKERKEREEKERKSVLNFNILPKKKDKKSERLN